MVVSILNLRLMAKVLRIPPNGTVLVVGVNSDASVRVLKGDGRPVVPAGHRAELLAALECVSYFVVFGDPTPEQCLLALKPDVHCQGTDSAPPYEAPMSEAACVASYGGRVEFLPLAAGLSSTDLIRRIRELPQT